MVKILLLLTLELEKAGANVTVLYRGDRYSAAIKPWILPNFESLVNHEKITMEFNANVTEITENSVIYEKNGKVTEIPNDHVFCNDRVSP